MRTADQTATFKRGLDVMASLYASLTGTTVLLQRLMPTRPATDVGTVWNDTPYEARGWVRIGRSWTLDLGAASLCVAPRHHCAPVGQESERSASDVREDLRLAVAERENQFVY